MSRSTTDNLPAGATTSDPGHDQLGELGTPGSPTGLSCPRCGGVLGEKPDGGQIRLECRLGHVVLLDALLDAKAAAVEDALWAAVRTLEEKAALSRRLCHRAQRQEDVETARRYERISEASHRRAGIVRDILHSHQSGMRAVSEG